MNTRHHRALAVLAVILAAVFSVTNTSAALNTYLQLDGQSQGQIEGDVTDQGREGTILVSEVHHLMHIPTDPHTGQPTGSLQHEPFIFTKEQDKATVGMYTAMVNSENLTAFFKYYSRHPATGQDIHTFTIRMNNARIIAIEPIKAETRDPANQTYPDMERIRMIYQEIHIINEEHGHEIQIDTRSQQ